MYKNERDEEGESDKSRELSLEETKLFPKQLDLLKSYELFHARRH